MINRTADLSQPATVANDRAIWAAVSSPLTAEGMAAYAGVMTTFTGTTGNDTIDATAGTISAGVTGTVAALQDATGDSINGGSGNDSIIAGSGDDNITGGVGVDSIDAGDGNDTMWINSSGELAAGEQILGGSGSDQILLFSAGTFDFSASTISGVETLSSGSLSNKTVTLTASQWAAFSTINLTGSTSDVLNVMVSGAMDISAAGVPASITNIEIGNLTGSTGADTLTITSAQLDAILIGSGATINLGSGTDTINLTSTSTQLNNLGAVDASISGVEVISASGASTGVTITLSAQTEALTITGGSGADSITGGAGADTITGGAGADTIDAGGGDDIINIANGDFVSGELIIGGANGGSGTRDQIVLTSAGTVDFTRGTVTGVETLTGSTGNDTVTVSATQWAGFVNAIDLGSGTDVLSVLASGNISALGVPPINASVETSKLIGTSGNDSVTLSGAQLDAILVGTGTINLGSGFDTINLTSHSADLNTLAGTDASISGLEKIDASASSPVTINMTGQSEGFTIIGTGGTDAITGGAGNDTIDGGGYWDYLYGGSGNDTITYRDAARYEVSGGAGSDTLLLAAAVWVDLSAGNQVWDSNSSYYVYGFENADASALGVAVTLIGDSGANVLTGGSGNDTITGGAGSDTIYGGAGNDSIVSGAGADTVDGGAGNDTINIASGDFISGESIDGGTGTDTISLTGGSVNFSTTGLSDASIKNVETITGASATTALTINLTGQTEGFTIIGSTYADMIAGGSGDDTVTYDALDVSVAVGAGFDTLLITSGSVTVDLSAADQTIGDNVNVSGFENVIVTGSGAVKLTAGNTGSVLSGGAGVDTITGGSGDDTINVANGQFVAGEQLVGGSGSDQIVLTNATTVDFSAGTVSGIETLTGSTGDDTVTMTALQRAAFETIDLGSGTDVLNIVAGGDISALDTPAIIGVQTGNLTGTSGADTMTLTGAQLDAILIGTGTINLGSGTDTINLTSTSSDLNALGVVNASISGVEVFSFAGAASGVSVNLSGQTEAFTITGSAAADTIVTGSGDDIINIAAGQFAVGESIQGGSDIGSVETRDQIVLTSSGMTVDFSTGTVSGVETLTGSTGSDTVTMTASEWAQFTYSINLGSGADVLNVVASGDISAFAPTTLGGVETGNLTGTAGTDTVTLTGTQLNAILIGAGTINLGLGTGDTINLTSNSTDLNTLGGTDASISGVEAISFAGATAGATIMLSGQSEAFAITGGNLADTITGGSGADTIVAGSGDDTINIAVGQFVAGEQIQGGANSGSGTRDQIVLTTSGMTVDFSTGAVSGIETLTGSSGNDTVTMTASEWAGFATIDLGSGTDVLNVVASGDISALAMPALSGIESGNLTGTSSSDTVTLTGAQLDAILIGTGTINLGDGTGDTINLTSTSSDLNTLVQTDAVISGVEAISFAGATAGGSITLSGQSEAFTITGSAGADSITGGSGNDTIAGSAGADTLIGGSGNDTITFDGADASIAGGAGTDTLIVTTAATIDLSAGDQSTGDTASVTGFENVDASGASVAVSLTGTALAETLTGGSGNDTIAGSAGADTLIGGAGNDTITFDGSDASVAGGTGTDTLLVTTAATIDLSAADQSGTLDNASVTGFENVNASASAAAVSLMGDANANVLAGGAGDNTIIGGAGVDTLIGGSGNDTVAFDGADASIAGGTGADMLLVTTAATINLSAADQSSGDNASVTGFENVDASGASVAVSLTGDSGVNTLTGGSGDDTIAGGGGVDTLDGGAGNDTLTYDGSDVSIAGGTGTDTLLVTAAATINLSSADQSSNDTASVTGFENVDASASGEAVSLAGDANANMLTGGSGNDTIVGGSGVDTLSGGSGNDTITFDGSDLSIAGGTGTDTLLVTTAATINLASGDQTSGDTASVTGFENIDASGSNGAVTLTGDSGANVLTGGSGDDTIVGGAGADTLSGGSGNDTITLDGADASIAGGTGADTLLVNSAATIDLSVADQSTGDTANVTGFENVDASAASLAVSLTGDSGVNALTGGSGNDTIAGGAGVDTLSGGSGNDTITFDSADVSITGGTGTDTLLITTAATIDLSSEDQSGILDNATVTGFENVDASGANVAVSLMGDSGANTLTGGSGDDTIIGGSGVDTLSGGTGNDTITFDSADASIAGGTGTDTLRVTGTATIDLSAAADQSTGDNATVTGFENVDASASSVTVSLTGDGSANVLTGGSGDDTITGGAGVDTIVAGSGNDTITLVSGDFAAGEQIQGGAGSDQIVLTSATTVDFAAGTVVGVETLTGSGGNDTVTMTAAQFAAFSTVNLGAGIDVLNVVASGDISPLATPAVSATVETGNLIGTTGDDAVTLTGAQLNAILAGSGGAINLGSGTDTINLTSTSTDLNALADTSIQGVERIDASSAEAGVTINLNAQNEAFTFTGGNFSDTLTGGSGADTIIGMQGADTIDGGAGNDTFWFHTGDFAAGEQIQGGAGSDRIDLQNSAPYDFSAGTISSVETLAGSGGNETVTMTTAQLAGFETIDLGGGADVLNVVASGDISALTLPTLAGIETGNLTGTGGADTVTLTGAQLDAILVGTGTVNLGGGTDTINLISTSADLNTLGATDTSIQGVEKIDASSAEAGVTITLSGQSEAFTITGSEQADTITGGVGNDTIDGGAGSDTVVLSGVRTDYAISRFGSTYTVIDNRSGSPDGTDTVTNVENFQFSGGTLTVGQLDTTAPTIASVAFGEHDGTLKAGESVDIVVTFSEAVIVTGTPTLTLSNGATAAFVVGGSGTNTLTFHYTVASSGQDTSDITVASYNLAAGGATVRDAQGNAATAAGAPTDPGGAGDAEAVDTVAPTATVTVNAITTDNIVNATEAGGTVAVTGTVVGEVHNGDTVTLTVNGNTYTGAVSNGGFSIDVPGGTLASGTSVHASVTTTDAAGNTTTATADHGYSVDTTPPTASIALATITADNIVNAAEASGTVAVTGTVVGDVHNGDIVTLTVDGHTYSGAVSNGGFSINVPGSILAAYAGTMVSASITTTDAAGNSATVNDSRTYTVDTVAPTASITVNAITANNIVNAAEAGGTVAVTGAVGGEVHNGDTVILTVDGNTYTGFVSNGGFSIDVPGSQLATDADTTVNASVTITDAAGNSTTANGSRTYIVDTAAPAASITVNAITADNIVNADEAANTVAVTGTVVGDVHDGDTVTLTVSGHTYSGAVSNGTFSIDAPGSLLATDAALAVYASVTTTDAAGNTKTATASHAYSVDTKRPAASVILATITADNIVNVTEAGSPGVAVTGTVGGAVTDGNTVTLTVGVHTYTGTVSSGGFSIDVPGSVLAASTTVYASVTATDAAGNSTTESDSQAYTVSTLELAAAVALNAIAADGIVNAAEAGGLIAVTGTVDGDVENGDTVTLAVNGRTYTGAVSNGGFSINVSWSDLAADADATVNASVTARDTVGNDTTAYDSRTYAVDTVAPVANVTLNAITANNIVNASEAVGTVAVTGTVGGDVKDGDTVTLTVNGNPYSGAVSNGGFSINVSGSELAADADKTVIASVTTTDAAGNSTTANDSRTYTVDAVAPTASITVNAITADNIVNATEEGGPVAVTGAVGGEVQNGDTVTLTINGQTYTGQVSNGGFNINVSGSDLAADADRTVGASVTITDAAGNSTPASGSKTYTVSTEALEASITLNPITADNIVNAAEAGDTVAVTGAVGGAVKNGDIVTLAVNGHTYTGAVSNGGFSIDVTGSDLAADADTTVNASVTASNVAGNSTTASGSRTYTVDTVAPTAIVTVNAITANNTVNAAEAGVTVAVTGTVGGDVHNGDIVTLTIDGNTYTGAVSNGGFSIGVPGSQLATSASTTVNASVTITDTAGNSTTASGGRTYTVDTVAPAASITVNAITVDNIVNASEAGGSVAVTGTVGGDVHNGDIVTLTIDGNTYTGAVSNGGFSIGVPGSQLATSASTTVNASVTITDTAGNSTTANGSRIYTVDTAAPTATITVNPITADSIVNAAEAGELVAVTGAVGGEVQNGATVTLTVNGSTYSGAVSNGGFSIDVPGSQLAADSDTTVAASVTITDTAGNNTTASGGRTYALDTVAPVANVTVNAITADNIVNAAEAGVSVAVSGIAGGAVKDGDIVTLAVNGHTYTGAVSNGGFSINVSGSELAADADATVNASVTTTDDAGNSTTANGSRSYTVDTVAPTASITVNAITANNIVNAAEAGGTVAVTGTVGGDVHNGDTVTLTVDGNTYAGAVSNGGFTINVPGSQLATDSDKTVIASVTTTDAAGNSTTASGSRIYTVDTVAPAATVTLDAITTDNILNAAEAGGTVAVTGTVVGEVHNGDTVTLTVDGRTYTGAVSNGSFSVNVPGSRLAADAYATVDASVTITDAAGNSTTANDSRTYTVDKVAPTASITVNPITADNIINATEAGGTVAVTGTVGGEVHNGDTVTLTVDGHTYTGAVSNGGFTINVPGSVLAADSGTTVNASVTITDTAGNSTTANGSRTYIVDTVAPTASITVNAITADNIVNAAEAGGTVVVTGTVGGEAHNGDTVILTVDGNTYAGAVSNGGFTINVPGSQLTTDTDTTVTASVITTDAAGNSTTASGSRTYTVDTAAPAAIVTVNAITANNIVNATEAGELVAVTGTVGGDVHSGAIVTLAINGHTYTGAVANGGFIIDVPGSQLAADAATTINASVTTTDAACNSTTVSGSRTYIVDTVAPTASVTLNPITADNILNATEAGGTVTVTGTVGGDVHGGDIVTLTVNGNTYSGAVSNGGFSIDVPGGQLAADSDATVNASVTTADAAGNTTTASGVKAYTLDTTADAGGNLAVSVGDGLVNNAEKTAASYTVVGLDGDATATVTFTSSGGGSPVVVNASGNGAATADLLGLADGTIAVSIAATDAAGNTTAGADASLMLDTTADAAGNTPVGAGASMMPFAASMMPADAAGDLAVSAGDNLVNNAEKTAVSYTVVGLDGDSTATVTFTSSGGGTPVVVNASGSGAATANLSGLADGTITVSIAATDAAGNTIAGTGTSTTTLDTTADVGGNLAVSAGDSLVSNAEKTAVSYTVVGLDADATATVTFTSSGGGSPVVVNASGNGAVTANLSGLNDGLITVSVSATDVAGNTTAGTGTSTTTLDTTATASIIVNTITADNMINAAEANGTVAVTGTVGGDVHNNDTVTLTINGQTYTGQVSNGGTFSIDVSGSDLAADSDTTVSASITTTDAAGNSATAPDSRTYAVSAVRPVASFAQSNPYIATEQTSLTLHNTGLSISDADAGSGTMTVTLSVTEGVLDVSAGDTGASVSNSGTALVTITGTVIQINDLLANNTSGTVSYINNSDAPSASVTLTMRVSDGVQSSESTATINIAPVNDAAVLSSATANLTETDTVLATGGTLTISDVDGPAVFQQMAKAGSYGSFSIGTDGAWTYTASTAHNEFAAGTTYTDTFAVAAADGTPTTVTINIAGTNDAPVFSSATAASFVENATGTVYDADATDAESSVALTYTLSGADAGFFSINQATGIVTFKAAPNFEAPADLSGNNVYDIIVTASDGTLGTGGRNVAITVTDLVNGDILNGTANVDSLVGTAGIDIINGLDGNDSITGGSGNDTLNGGAGNDRLDGGIGADRMVGGVGNDTYLVKVAGDTIVEGVSSGTDTVQSSITFTLASNVENLTLLGTTAINGTGNTLNNVLIGNAGANVLNGAAGNDTLNGGLGIDTLNGGAGKDALNGGTGNDTLNGGAGNDILTGGAGKDTFFFNTALNATTNIDQIKDFVVLDDTIRLENAIFTALTNVGVLAAGAFYAGTAAHDADDRIIYNKATGALTYDANGNAAGGAVQFATLGLGLALTNADFVVV